MGGGDEVRLRELGERRRSLKFGILIFSPLILLFYFLIFLFPFSSSLSRGLGCNLGTRRLMAGQSPLDVASVRFLTSLCPQ
jgi:hypothetical protein